MFGTILIERHEEGCTCSYCGGCGQKAMRYGLNIPPDWKAWNSWYVLKPWRRLYLRWTNGWLKFFKKPQHAAPEKVNEEWPDIIAG